MSIFGVLLSSCGASDDYERGPAVDLRSVQPVAVERLDRLVADAPLMPVEPLSALIDSMQPGIDLYLRMSGYDVDSLQMVNGLMTMADSAPVKVFSPDVERYLPSLDSLEMQLGALKIALAANYPKARIARVFGVVSPYRQGVITSDSIVMVALNLYLGPKYPGYKAFDSYFRKSRIPRRMIYDIAEASLAAAYPSQLPTSATLLQRMLYEGALVKGVVSSVPDADLATAIGVSAAQLDWMRDNEADIWHAIVARNLLYSPSRVDAAKLLDPAPSTPMIHPEAPGRLGRYIGYRIVDSYLRNHPEAKVSDLLSPQFITSDRSLPEAAYHP